MKARTIKPHEVWPRGWKELLTDHPVAAGMDVATTEQKTSNPSAIAVVQKVALDYIVRAIVKFKTSDPAIMEAVLDELLDLPRGLRLRKLCIDASNERFFAARQKTRLAGRVWVEPVVSGETLDYLGETMTFKSYLGNLFCNTIHDGHLLLPESDWLRADIRQVKTDRGTFVADVDAAGNHADGFDGIKLGLHGLISTGGPAMAQAVPVGAGFGSKIKAAGRALLNPFAGAHEARGTRHL